MAPLGQLLVILGVSLTLVGLVLWFGGRWIGWLGRLPGDIRIEGEKGAFYFPVVTCIVVSIILTVVLSVIRRYFGN